MPLHYIMLLLLLKMECSPKNSHKECNNRGNDAGIHRVCYQRSVSTVPGGRCRCRLLCMGCRHPVTILVHQIHRGTVRPAESRLHIVLTATTVSAQLLSIVLLKHGACFVVGNVVASHPPLAPLERQLLRFLAVQRVQTHHQHVLHRCPHVREVPLLVRVLQCVRYTARKLIQLQPFDIREDFLR
uniref:Secreted peptide n=1 Tax=Anopheles braziliensis TaxID=58242 RepID=A0A2M3ZL79_9DIPT